MQPLPKDGQSCINASTQLKCLRTPQKNSDHVLCVLISTLNFSTEMFVDPKKFGAKNIWTKKFSDQN
jgi:hypothetical protein